MKEIYQYYASSDLLLKTYDELPDGFVSHEQLSEIRSNCPVPDEEEVYSFLVEEGLFKEFVDGNFILHSISDAQDFMKYVKRKYDIKVYFYFEKEKVVYEFI